MAILGTPTLRSAPDAVRFFPWWILAVLALWHSPPVALAVALAVNFARTGNRARPWTELVLYFALVFAGGHLNHETIHSSEDRAAGLNTSAIRFGKEKTFFAGFVIFSLSFLYLAILAWIHLLPFSLIYAAAVLYPAYGYFFLTTWRNGLGTVSMISFRRRYRLIYIILGIYFWFTLIWRIQ